MGKAASRKRKPAKPQAPVKQKDTPAAENAPASTNQRPEYPKNNPSKSPWRKWTKPIVQLTALAVLTGMFSAFILWQQDIKSDENYARILGQADRLIANSKEISIALQESVAQSQKALDVSIANSRNDQRAWVLPYFATMTHPLEAGGKVLFTLRARSSGKTPAFAKMSAHITIYPTDDLPDEMLIERPDAPTSRMTIVPPDMPDMMFSDFMLNVPVPEALTGEQITEVNSGAAHFYIIGKLTYKDAFGGDHTTRFCYFVKGGEWNGGNMRTYWKGWDAN